MNDDAQPGDITPIPNNALPTHNDGGPDFVGGEGQDDNQTTKDPLAHADEGASGDSSSEEAVGMARNPGATATTRGGGGL